MGNSNERAQAVGSDIESEAWQVRVGQIETVLSFFGTLCSVSVEAAVGGEAGRRDTVYVQAQRVDGGLELEMTGNTYLFHSRLTPERQTRMVELGWRAPEPPVLPNFSRFVPTSEDVHELAVSIAQAFVEVYGAGPDDEWVVSPPEFGHEATGLAPLTVVDLDACPTEADLAAERRRVLAEESGAALVSVILRDDVTWQELVDAGLPRGDGLAEMAMLHRPDCPLEFLRKSRFHHAVLEDPTLPVQTAQAVVDSEPTAWELRSIATRGDIDTSAVSAAAVRGAKLANWQGRTARPFLEIELVPPAWLRRLSDQHDDDTVGMLRHPRCPEEVVLKHVLARSARVRYAALRATQARSLAVDSALVRLAGKLPTTERPNTTFPFAPRIQKVVDEILAAR